MCAIYQITQKTILTKNAWNCFRIKSFYNLFPNIHFIWIRRDIGLSALSDLEARKAKGNPQRIWNSATPRNYRAIQKKPYWEQVVEQQYEFNITISRDLNKYCRNRFVEIWYTNLCNDTEKALNQLNAYFKKHSIPINKKSITLPKFNTSKKYLKTKRDHEKISQYILANNKRFESFINKECE